MDFEYLELNQLRINTMNKIEDFISKHQGKILKSLELNTIFQLYKNLRATYTNPSSNLASLSWVLYFIIEESYKSKEGNSFFIVELLDSLVRNEGHTYFLLNLSQFPIPTKTIFEFMLDHTNALKSLFRGYRLVCLPSFSSSHSFTPIELALCFKSPTLVHCLLRYGAVYSYLEGYGERVRYQWTLQDLPCPSTRLCADIISYLIKSFQEFNAEMKMLRDLDDISRRNCELLVKCGLLVLKDMPLLKMRYLFNADGKVFTKEHITNVLRQMNGFMPGILDYFCSPQTLKHASKLVVRKLLNNNWQLPDGIYHLQIPNYLTAYLDLKDGCYI